MIVKSVQAENFMSFKDLHYEFPQRGLYFIGGEIAGKQLADSNGAGKSAFIEALAFGLFGKTLRDAGKDDIINRSVGKNCGVIIEFDDDIGDFHRIIRCRKSDDYANELIFSKGDGDKYTELTGADSRATQDSINKVLGLNWLVFSTAVIFGSQALRFSEARPSEKAEVLDEIMMFQPYRDAQDAVKNHIIDLKDKRGTAEFGLGGERSVLGSTEEELTEVENRAKGAEKRHEQVGEEIETLQGNREIISDMIEKMKARIGKMIIEVTSLEEDRQKLLDAYEKTLKEQEEAMKVLGDKATEARIALEKVTSKMKELQSWIRSSRDLLNLSGNICPTCRHEITADSLDKVREHCEKELASFEQEEQELHNQWAEAARNEQEKREIWRKKLDKIQDTKMKLEDILQTQREAVKEKQIEIEREVNKLEVIDNEIRHKQDKLEEEKADLIKQKQRLEKKIEEIKEVIAGLEGEIQNMEEEEKRLDFWVEGFGNQGIKSLLLDEILPQINTRVAYYASALMDDEIQIEFDTEKLLKSGETRNKFDIKILQGKEVFSYKNYSGGEKQRIDVAIILALQSVIYERAVSSCNLVVFDEVFERLDSVGIERVVFLLAEEAKDKAIFVISHQNELRDYFNDVIMIKNENGISRLEA